MINTHSKIYSSRLPVRAFAALKVVRWVSGTFGLTIAILNLLEPNSNGAESLPAIQIIEPSVVEDIAIKVKR